MSAVAEVPVHLKAALTPNEVAALVGLSASTIRRLVRDGVLRPVPHAPRVLIARAEVDRWVSGS
jgi:excisionase family DNA binding protein